MSGPDKGSIPPSRPPSTTVVPTVLLPPLATSTPPSSPSTPLALPAWSELGLHSYSGSPHTPTSSFQEEGRGLGASLLPFNLEESEVSTVVHMRCQQQQRRRLFALRILFSLLSIVAVLSSIAICIWLLVMEQNFRGVIGTAATFVAGGVVVSSAEIFQHLHCYSRPVLQKQIVRLLCLVPIYACCSLLSLIWPHAGKWFDGRSPDARHSCHSRHPVARSVSPTRVLRKCDDLLVHVVDFELLRG